MCFLGVIKFFSSPQSLICWSSQKCSPHHQFDLVYDMLIPRKYQYIFSDGVTLECMSIKISYEIMYNDSLT